MVVKLAVVVVVSEDVFPCLQMIESVSEAMKKKEHEALYLSQSRALCITLEIDRHYDLFLKIMWPIRGFTMINASLIMDQRHYRRTFSRSYVSKVAGECFQVSLLAEITTYWEHLPWVALFI